MFSRLDRIRACDRRTERRTDRRTNFPQRNARYAFASRVKNSRVCEVSDFWTLQILIALGRKRLHWLSLTLRWTNIKSAQFIIVTPSAWFVCKKKTICCDVFVLCFVFSSVAISLNIHSVSCNYKTSLKFIPINGTLSQMTLIFYSAVSRSLVICYKFTSESAGERILTRSALLRPVYSDTTQLNSTDPVEQRTAKSVVFLIMASWPTNWVNWVTTFIDRWQLFTL